MDISEIIIASLLTIFILIIIRRDKNKEIAKEKYKTEMARKDWEFCKNLLMKEREKSKGKEESIHETNI